MSSSVQSWRTSGHSWSSMTNRVTERIRRVVEAMLPWFDRTERDRRAAQTERHRRRAIAVRIRAERVLARSQLASYHRVRIGR